MNDLAVHPEIYGLSLCSGVGGLDLALRIALGERFRCVAYVEREAYAAATLAARMEDGSLHPALIWDDLRTFPGALFRDSVALLTAGFPCQPWSVAGKRKGTADERWLWDDIARIIGDVRPPLIFLENVRGLLNASLQDDEDDSDALGEWELAGYGDAAEPLRAGIAAVLGSLADLGYDAEWLCLSAAQVGATHRRERVFILAHRNDLGREGSLGPAELWAAGRRGTREPTGGGRDVRLPLDDACHERLQGISGAGATAPPAIRAGRTVVEVPLVGDAGQRPGGRRSPDCRCAEAGAAGAFEPRSAGVPDSGPSKSELAHANLRGCQCVGEREAGRRIEPASGSPLPDFPPGPRDFANWAHVLAQYPDLAPATAVEPRVRGVADELAAHLDGSAVRPDRLRAGGNGVVPLQAAAAFVELLRRTRAQ